MKKVIKIHVLRSFVYNCKGSNEYLLCIDIHTWKPTAEARMWMIPTNHHFWPEKKNYSLMLLRCSYYLLQKKVMHVVTHAQEWKWALVIWPKAVYRWWMLNLRLNWARLLWYSFLSAWHFLRKKSRLWDSFVNKTKTAIITKFHQTSVLVRHSLPHSLNSSGKVQMMLLFFVNVVSFLCSLFKVKSTLSHPPRNIFLLLVTLFSSYSAIKWTIFLIDWYYYYLTVRSAWACPTS